MVDGRGRHVRHSYSGFNSLQVAAERPPALKAVVAIYATDDRYWRHGSLRPAYERIACPTMIVAGWADGYRNATFRVLERLRAPSWLLLGPWSHMATDGSLPGPRIDLVPEMVRWWDRWLRGERNGVDEAPPVTVFVRHATRPPPTSTSTPASGATSRSGPRSEPPP